MHKLSDVQNVAIILAAGRGDRLRPLSDKYNKCMIPIDDHPILHWTLKNLFSIDENMKVIIVTGYKYESINEYIKDNVLSLQYSSPNISLIQNKRWSETNNIYSLKLALDHIDKNYTNIHKILLLEGDVINTAEALKKLYYSVGSACLVYPDGYSKKGSCVDIDSNGFVKNIVDNKDTNDKSLMKLVNMYSIVGEDIGLLYSQFKHLKSKDVNEYYESIINRIIGKIRLNAIIEGSCKEIDNIYDLYSYTLDKSIYDNKELDYGSIKELWGGLWRYNVKDFYFISNPYYPNKFMIDRLRDTLPTLISNYPSHESRIGVLIGSAINSTNHNIIPVNGASEAITILSNIFKDKIANILTIPTFNEYKRFNRKKGIKGTIAIVVCPNNPTGEILSTCEIREHIDNFEFVIVDLSLNVREKYEAEIIQLAMDHKNLIIIKSLSKLYGIPGLRLGYIYTSNSELSNSIYKMIPIWNINSVTEKFLELHLENIKEYKQSLVRWAKSASDLVYKMQRLGYDCKNAGIFITGKCKYNLAEELLKYNIFIADTTSKMLELSTYDGHYSYRIGVRSNEENNHLLDILKIIKSEPREEFKERHNE